MGCSPSSKRRLNMCKSRCAKSIDNTFHYFVGVSDICNEMKGNEMKGNEMKSNDLEESIFDEKKIENKFYNNNQYILGLTTILSNILLETTCMRIESYKFSAFKKIHKLTPSITVLGEQGSGKSTLLNNLCELPEELKLKSCDGMTTKRPTEIHLSPYYENEVFVETLSGIVKVESYEDALNFFDDEEDYNGKIVIKKNHPTLMLRIVDLPGCNNNNKANIKKFKKEYLEKENTILLHVMIYHADIEANISTKHITGKNVIKVLTKTDECDRKKTIFINRTIEENKAVALVNNQKDETKHNNKFIRICGDYINGTDELRKYVINLSNKIIKKSIPKMKEICDKALEEINILYETINKEYKTKESIINGVKKHITLNVNNVYGKHGTSITKEINIMLNKLDSKKICEWGTSDLPEEDKIKKDLELSGRRTFKGGEGWSPMIKDLIKAGGDNINYNMSEYVTEFTDMLAEKYINDGVTYYSEFTSKIEEKLKNWIKFRCETLKKEFLQELKEYIDTITENPVCGEDIKSSNIEGVINFGKELLRLCIEKQIEGAEVNYDILSEINISDFVDEYKDKAKDVRKNFNAFWRLKSNEIHNNFISYFYKYDKKMKEICDISINEIDQNDIVKFETLEAKRLNIKELKGLLEKLKFKLAGC